MTDIKVIFDSGPNIQLDSITPEEREVIFDQIGKDNKEIPRSVIDGFHELQQTSNRETLQKNRPEIKELLLRKIIKLSRNGNRLNTIVIPVIPSLSKKVTFETKKKNRRDSPPDKSIRVNFDENILAVTADGLDYIVPPGEELNVIGLIINPFCQKPKTLGRDNLRNLFPKTTDMPSVGNKLLIGRYQFPDAARACDGYFDSANYDITIAAEINSEPFKITFELIKGEKINDTLIVIFDYLIDIITYYHGADAAYYIHRQLAAAVQSSGNIFANQKLSKLFDVKSYNYAVAATDKPAREKIMDILEGVHFGRFDTTYGLSVIADMSMRGFSDIYQHSLVNGPEAKSTTDLITLFREQQARRAFQRDNYNTAVALRTNLNTRLQIVEKVLGAKRLVAIEKQLVANPLLAVSDGILKLLKPAEQKLVSMEYKRREDYFTAVINNKCPHVKLYKSLRRSRADLDTKRFYKDLTGFFKNPSDAKMISCNNCGFDIICPHIRDLTVLELGNKSHAEIKSKLTKYIDTAMVKNQFHCKICGEMISSLEAFGDATTIQVRNNMDEELSQFIWGEVAINTKYLKFDSVVNITKLISAARDAIYPFVFDIEKQIQKSKTSRVDETKAKKRLYSTIYAFAYFIHLIMSNIRKGSVSFKNFVTKSAKNTIVDMIKHSLDLIVLSRNVIIREIPGMSRDVIKNTLVEAYKTIQSKGSHTIVRSSDAEEILTTLVLDPAYRYYYQVNLLDEVSGSRGRKVPHGAFDIVDQLDKIMGPVAKLEKAEDIFANAKVPKFTGWRRELFDSLEKMSGGAVFAEGSGKKSPAVNVFHAAHPGYIAASFEMFAERVSSRSYAEALYVNSGVISSDPAAAVESSITEIHEKQMMKFEEVRGRETLLLEYKAFLGAQNYTVFPVNYSMQWSKPTTAYSRSFDESGIPHKWDIYVAETTVGGKTTKREFKIGDIVKSLADGKKFENGFTTRKCSTCGATKGTVDKLSESKIMVSILDIQNMDHFFKFYEYRCPADGLHVFEKSVCTKCGISRNHAEKPLDSAEYYRKYKKKYETDMSDGVAPQVTKTEKKVAKPSEGAKFAKEYASWAFNFNNVLSLSDKLDISAHLLSSLGAGENQLYEDVQSGTFIPTEEDSPNTTRIFVLDGHVKNLITAYNQLKYFHRAVKPAFDFVKIMDASGISKHKFAEVSKKLPDIFDNYNERFTYFQRNKKPREIASFCIQSFCEKCLKIWEDPTKETKRMRVDFVTFIVKKILRAEELLTKAGAFNWSILYGDKEKETSSKSSFVIEEEPKPEDEGGTGEPFSNDAFDMTDDFDNDDNINNTG